MVLPMHAWYSPCALGTPHSCLVLPMRASSYHPVGRAATLTWRVSCGIAVHFRRQLLASPKQMAMTVACILALGLGLIRTRAHVLASVIPARARRGPRPSGCLWLSDADRGCAWLHACRQGWWRCRCGAEPISTSRTALSTSARSTSMSIRCTIGTVTSSPLPDYAW